MPSPPLAILQRQRKPHLHHIPFGSSTSQNGNVGVVICGTPRLFFCPVNANFLARGQKKSCRQENLGALRSPHKLTKTRANTQSSSYQLQSRFQSLPAFWSAGPAKTQKTVATRSVYDNQYQWLSLFGPGMKMWALSLAPKHPFGNPYF